MLLPSMVTFLWSEMSLHQQAQKLEATRKEMEGGEKEGKKKKAYLHYYRCNNFSCPCFSWAGN